MQITVHGPLVATALIASTLAAQAQATDSGVELAFMPRTMTVALLNEGGKYVAIDFKHIPQGDPHRRVGFVIVVRQEARLWRASRRSADW